MISVNIFDMKNWLIAGAFLLGGLVYFGNTAGAADVFHESCKLQPNSTLCKQEKSINPNDANDNPIYGPNGVLTKIINIITILVGIAATIMIIVGGFKLITSGSNAQEVTKARETILYAIVGLIVVALAQLLVRFFLNRVL